MSGLLNEFVHEFRENNTYVIQKKTALKMGQISVISTPPHQYNKLPSFFGFDLF